MEGLLIMFDIHHMMPYRFVYISEQKLIAAVKFRWIRYVFEIKVYAYFSHFPVSTVTFVPYFLKINTASYLLQEFVINVFI